MEPIAGIRIVDMTSVLMGPYATRLLGDMGADIIKIESPQIDSMRTVKPSRSDGMAGAILNLHANKRSVVLDLKQEKAREAALRLIAEADVFVHNMRPGAIAKLRLDYENVKAVNPDIIYCNAYGFGRDGPYRDKAAYDDAIQAASGIPALIARARGEPDFYPSAICDKIGGLTIVYSVLAALLGRAMGKGGQEIEVPMFETAAAFNAIEHLCGFAFDPPLEDFGWRRILARNRRPFPTSDGYACILPYSTENWRDFFIFADRADLVHDDRYATHPKRIANIDFLYGLIAEVAPRHSTAEWMAFCDSHSIPAMPVLDGPELWNDPQIQSSGVLGYDEHPTEGRYRTVNQPARFGGAGSTIRRHAPRAGEHTADILAEIGYAPEEVGAMIAAGAAVEG
ncbi:MAG: CoA transferase [Rhizobiaceae bacterium]